MGMEVMFRLSYSDSIAKLFSSLESECGFRPAFALIRAALSKKWN